MIHSTGVSYSPKLESSVLSNAFVCILLAPEVQILFLSRLFRAILFDDVNDYDANMNSSMKRDLPMETIVSKRLRSRNETCAKLFVSLSLSVSSFSWHSVLKALTN